MKQIAIIVDKGDVYEITDTIVQPEGYQADGTTTFEIKDKNLFQLIRQKLENNIVQYPKDLDGELIEQDLLIRPIDPFTQYKALTEQKAREYISTRLNPVSMFELYDFILCNNELLDRGYVITNSNRREKYIEIIEDGDAETIDFLETYLNSKDKLEAISGWYRQYRQFEADLAECQSVEEIDKRYKEFVQIFE